MILKINMYVTMKMLSAKNIFTEQCTWCPPHRAPSSPG